MTLRLVALMSVVLLLSLAAVGLLVNHYQERFMQEVQATASDVGQAALRTLDWTGSEGARFGKGVVHRRPARQGDGPASAEEADGMSEEVHDVIATHLDGGAVDERVRQVRHIITTTTEDNQFTVSEQLIYPADAFPTVLPGEALEDEFEACLQGRVEALSGEDKRIFINVAAVRAETDPSRGLVLKIPKFTPADGEGAADATGTDAKMRFEFKPLSESATEDVFLARHDEIQLPIRGNYQELFGKLRNRSLFLFMGVFLVGMVLSTGLASRFTRPIRKLDAGIRRLSEGDLDVEVAVHDKGEIGRLGRTFNEMAAKLRASREREREVVRREKLSALGRLAAGVAHDVRNPLHSIGLTLQHLSETARPESGERQREFDHSVEVIRGEIGRLDRLVGNFLRFAKSERRERQPVDLGELLRETARLVQKESERRRVRIDLEAGEALPAVLVDAEAIRSALLNLILNSFEAMPDGGELSLRLQAEGDEVVLEVADTGEGIPEDEQEHVFDFAYTTREGGNGLGLAMVHHCVVEEHGGRVTLESRAGQGTRVRLMLPTRNGEAS
jgi:signal transduction histidine kinase